MTPFTSGLQRRCLDSCRRSCRSARRRCTTRLRRPPRQVATREGRRRAVVVFTDGNDNASRLTPDEVSGIASAIDVPVYIVGIVPVDRQPVGEHATSSATHSALAGALAIWPRGPAAACSSSARRPQRSVAARQIVDELRHQYLIAFESSGKPGWHPLVVRAREQGPRRSRPERIYRGAISPEFCSRRDRSCSGSVSSRSRSRCWRLAARPPAPRRSSCRTSVGEVNDKVDSLGQSVEETQERTRQNEGQIADVDQKAQAAAAGGAAQAQRRRRRGATQPRTTADNDGQRPAARKARRDRQGLQAAGLRSRAERGRGQLQVRPDEAAG